MPKTANLVPYRDADRAKPWRVDVPASVSPNGKRQRFYFEHKKDAENYCEEQKIRLKNFGLGGLEIIKPAQIDQAANAFKLIEPYGVTLTEVVTEWIQRKRASEASIPFEEAMSQFGEYGRRSPSYARSIRQTQNRLESLHDRLLNTITPEDLTRAMDGMPGSVRNFTIRILGGLFNFAIKRGYCADNPCKRLDLSQREATEIEVYTPAEVAAILLAAETHDPELLPFLALSFFCGIRRAEALRLDWSAIDLYESFVKLPASITKTRQGRHIEISENCKRWLAPSVQDVGRVTPFSPDILRKRMAALQAHHNVRTIKHGPRHCFASYWLAKHEEINKLCLFLGHDDPETTFRHYAKAATKRDSEKFWMIAPQVETHAEVIPFRARKAAI